MSALVIDKDAAHRARLKALEDRIGVLTGERAKATTAFTEARDKFVADGGDPHANSETYKTAEQAKIGLSIVEDELDLVTKAQVTLLKQLGTGDNGNGHHIDPEHRSAVKAMMEEPGRWLSEVLRFKAMDIPALRAQDYQPRFSGKAAPAQLTGIDVQSLSDAAIDLLSPRTAVFASGVPILPIDSTSTNVPRFTDLPVAGWRAEGGPFAKNSPGLEMVDSKPDSCGLVSPLSIEVWDDLTPAALTLLQVQILRAVGIALDFGLLFGDGTNNTPIGIAETAGVGSVGPVALNGMAPFASAIAALIASNAAPMALVMNPTDVGVLLGLVEETGSLVPLWQASMSSGVFNLKLPYFDVPLFVTPGCPAKRAVMYDPSTSVAVIRKPASIEVDPYYDLDNGLVGLRCYVRADIIVTGEGVVEITFS